MASVDRILGQTIFKEIAIPGVFRNPSHIPQGDVNLRGLTACLLMLAALYANEFVIVHIRSKLHVAR
jgi:hypothetical protein